MAVQYRLPCPQCGTEHLVDKTEAGTDFPCKACSTQVEVPTLLGFRQLEEVVEERPEPQPVWGPRQALLFIGGLFAIIAGIAIGIMIATMPRYQPQIVSKDRLEAEVGLMSIEETYEIWRSMESIPLNDEPDENLSRHRQLMAAWYRWMAVGIFVEVIGLCLIVGGVSTKQSYAQPTYLEKERVR
ncbi:Hypothetical protein PBC10988_25480 [Planctomycetales bacterium 10988]|nr:Hypothetical protein PBC10988_25480 [Planctomycetales bacterium 10988]